jgi:hypothetical protein
MTTNLGHHHRKSRAIAVTALVIGVLSLGVAFAALSAELRINGAAKIATASWDVHWTNVTCSKTGEASFATPSISTNVTTNDTLTITPTFKTNGDTVTCTFDATNGGTIGAKLGTIVNNLTNLTSNNINAVLTYANNAVPAVDDPLGTGASQGYKLVMNYTGAPVGTEVSGITFTYTIPYVQAS